MEDLFRSKLYDFEADTDPGDWEAIAGRLSDRKVVPLRRRLYYWGAAAAVLLLLVTVGVYWPAREVVPSSVVEEIREKTEQAMPLSRPVEEAVAAVVEEDSHRSKQPQVAPAMKRSVAMLRRMQPVEERAVAAAEEPNEEPAADQPRSEQAVSLFADNASDGAYDVDEEKVQPDMKRTQQKQPRKRKWGFGLGGGGLSMGVDNMVPSYVTNSTSLRGESLLLMNAPYFNKEAPKTDIQHKTPVSFGLSVSRYLTDRFSLQMGLTYSFLSSEWTTSGDYHGRTKQKLHFIGLPVSLTYKLAEWNRFVFYLSAGAMTEVNVAGTLSSRLYNDSNQEITRLNDRIRMKEWLWSVNAAGGVSYPVWRFVSAFAEVGASYYFDNGSQVETIHSEKPFNVNVQLGFRLGF